MRDSGDDRVIKSKQQYLLYDPSTYSIHSPPGIKPISLTLVEKKTSNQKKSISFAKD